jgi:gas vesicle protein
MLKRGSAFGVGLLLGMAIGVTICFLFAPQSGAATKQLIRRKIEAIEASPEEIVERAKRAAREKAQ